MSAIQQLSDDPALPMEKVIEEAIANRDYFRDLDDKFTSGSLNSLQHRRSDASPAMLQRFRATRSNLSSRSRKYHDSQSSSITFSIGSAGSSRAAESQTLPFLLLSPSGNFFSYASAYDAY